MKRQKPTNKQSKTSSSDIKIDESGCNSFVGNDQERIRKRAYELAEQRGFTPGHEVEDWAEAERQLKH